MRDNRFDIQAVLPAGSDKDDARAMMKSLLAERFGLIVHTTSKSAPGYALTILSKGTSLNRNPFCTAHAVLQRGLCSGYSCTNITMAGLAELLSIRRCGSL